MIARLEDRVVERRQRGRHGHQREPPRRPLAHSRVPDRLDGHDDHCERRALPRLEPGDDEGAGGREPQPQGSPLAPPALHGEEDERHKEDRDRRHQVAPQVLARPHLARDEVERVGPRVPAPPGPRHDGAGGHHREQHDRERGPAAAAGREEPPHVGERAGEGDDDGERLPQQVGGRDGEPGRSVEQPGEQVARVQEGPAARREVEAVADQPVVGGLTDPREVLELIGRVEPIGARQRATPREQRPQERQRDPGEDDEAAELEAIEPEPPGCPTEGVAGPLGGRGRSGHRGDRSSYTVAHPNLRTAASSPRSSGARSARLRQSA